MQVNTLRFIIMSVIVTISLTAFGLGIGAYVKAKNNEDDHTSHHEPTPGPPGPSPPPGPPGPPSNTKWEGWATTTYDGPGDASGRFCGELLDGVPTDDITNAGVSVPWIILCREFKSKNCLLNHMCPSCLTCGKHCGSADTAMAGRKATSCPDTNTYQKGIDKYGICWQAHV